MRTARLTIRVCTAAAILCVALPATGLGSADRGTIEVTGLFGYTFSEGFRIEPPLVSPSDSTTTYGKVGPKSGISYGIIAEIYVDLGISLGFLWDQQQSTFVAQRTLTGEDDVTDMRVNNYHGIVAYHFGWPRDPVRPFLFGGLGATHYTFDPVMGQEIRGTTKFSSTWGGGVKFYRSQRLGFRLAARWTPTLILSEPDGVVCGPYWGCWRTTRTDHSHQFQLSGGVVLRF